MKKNVQKKRVALVTIFDTINFGTYLQAFATAIKMQELGADVEIVRYERVHNRYRFPNEYKFKFLKIATWLCAVLTKNRSFFQKKKCRKFVSNHVKVSRLFYTYDDLRNNYSCSDVFVTGSDQVWNTVHNSGIEKAYYLEFVDDSIKKVAFSASIGMSCWDAKYLKESKNLLERYDSISVREDQAVSLLKEIGIEAQKVVDPTFLLSRDEWSKYAKPYKNNKPYVLVYSVEGGDCDLIVSKVARQAANELGAEVIEVNYVGDNKQIPDCDKRFYYATPEIFLSLILGASYTVVSSFHGTAFSINLNIPFISVAPERFSSRIDSLLRQTGMMSRKLSDYNFEIVSGLILENVDFSNANKILRRDIQSSIEFIKNNIIN